MRSSRVSRETARLASALQSRTSSPRTPQKIIKLEPDDQQLQTPSSLKRKRESSTQEPKVEIKELEAKEETVIRTSTRKAGNTVPKRAKRLPAKRIKGEDGEIRIEPPSNWQEMYETTREMRALMLAPVDTMGCESLAEGHRCPKDQRFQTLISLMLSSQTKDTVTAVAMKNMQENIDGGLTLESILAIQPERLNELISKVGFHNNKTKYIKATAEILRDRFDSDIPDTIEGMVSLPGVGPKMAYLCMSAAWGRDEGIGVDVHVHRITNLWGWHKTTTPEETRAALESWLPREKWHDINHLLVGFGQTWCPPVGRKCDDCRLAQGLCPSAVVGRSIKKKVKKEVQTIKGENSENAVKQEVEFELDVSNIKAEDLDSDGLGDIEDIKFRLRR